MELFALIAISIGILWFLSDTRIAGTDTSKETKPTLRVEAPPADADIEFNTKPIEVESGLPAPKAVADPADHRAPPPSTKAAFRVSPPRPKPLVPPPPSKLNKAPVLDAALRGALSYEQTRAVLDNASRYDFTTDEVDLLQQYAERKCPKISPPALAVHSADSWWSRER